ncbi:uncharacterized protein EV420DRAFT_642706 [Desarmillaria tabescens]|uniref:Uncharacterized protein n=1 Tax=Armillaria tabescens TaxID=1929756 RepID=A0AA39TUD0_ARMTA|nr:uncharacterized protein EV420DRAFT_642706 [Desarmillaria tabescens]KAK0466708.1 hypothetical protein EV420DRAFT_642706 [Desarmillaria tabescens]
MQLFGYRQSLINLHHAITLLFSLCICVFCRCQWLCYIFQSPAEDDITATVTQSARIVSEQIYRGMKIGSTFDSHPHYKFCVRQLKYIFLSVLHINATDTGSRRLPVASRDHGQSPYCRYGCR